MQGVILDNGYQPSTLTNTEIRLYHSSTAQDPQYSPYSGINSLATGCIVSGGSIHMDASISGRGYGVHFGRGSSSDNHISGVTFTNLEIDFTPYNIGTSTTYTGNSSINVAYPYTP